MLEAYVIEREEEGLALVVDHVLKRATVVEILRPQNLVASYLPSDRKPRALNGTLVSDLTDNGIAAVTSGLCCEQYANRLWKRGVEARRVLRAAFTENAGVQNPWFPLQNP